MLTRLVILYSSTVLLMWMDTHFMLVFRRQSVEKQPTRPLKKLRKHTISRLFAELATTHKQGRWLLYGLSLLLAILLVIGAVIGQPTIHNWFAPGKSGTSQLQHILHPETTVVHSSGIDHTVHDFMKAMLQRNWDGMWSILALDAQKSWH